MRRLEQTKSSEDMNKQFSFERGQGHTQKLHFSTSVLPTQATNIRIFPEKSG